MDELRSLDEVAFVRFASVYRSFKDLEEFRAEIERIALKTEQRQHNSDSEGDA